MQAHLQVAASLAHPLQARARHSTGAAPRVSHLSILLCCLALSHAAVLLHTAGAVPANPPQENLAQMLEYCNQFDDLYQAIQEDLKPWKAGGIDRASMAQSIIKFTGRGANKGIALAFLNGTAYVVESNLAGPVGHHSSAYFAYMRVMLELQQMFGHLIPDVEFVLATSDRPMVLLSSPRPHLPVFRFCSSDAHADIQVPIFHFHTKKYTQTMLKPIPEVNEEYPWEKKKEVLFGRFANYVRFIDPGVAILQRTGAGNSVICSLETPNTTACMVRQHMNNWSKSYPDLMDIKSTPRLAMQKHAGYKYLLHLDGQALSSRIDLLLPLNSLIFKEESGYKTFYHHLIKPMVHYVPVWKKTPEDILTALAWAKENDQEAREIASNAQKFAIKYLNKRTRACYWFRLLVEFSKLLRYKVSPEHEVQEEQERQLKAQKKQRGKPPARSPSRGATAQTHSNSSHVNEQQDRKPRKSASPLPPEFVGVLGRWKTVEEYLDTIPMNYEGGKWFSNKTEEFGDFRLT